MQMQIQFIRHSVGYIQSAHKSLSSCLELKMVPVRTNGQKIFYFSKEDRCANVCVHVHVCMYKCVLMCGECEWGEKPEKWVQVCNGLWIWGKYAL